MHAIPNPSYLIHQLHCAHFPSLLTSSTGPYSCVGKQLALMELRTVISLLISRFDISLAPGEDGSALLNDTKDTFTVRLGGLQLVFVEREKRE